MNVRIRYEDGHYALIPDPEGQLKLTDHEWELYQQYLAISRVWQRYICKLDNETFKET